MEDELLQLDCSRNPSIPRCAFCTLAATKDCDVGPTAMARSTALTIHGPVFVCNKALQPVKSERALFQRCGLQRMSRPRICAGGAAECPKTMKPRQLFSIFLSLRLTLMPCDLGAFLPAGYFTFSVVRDSFNLLI